MTKPETFTDLTPSELIQQALTRNEGLLTNTGALLITTGKRTGRSPNDRYIVDESSTSGVSTGEMSTSLFWRINLKHYGIE